MKRASLLLTAWLICRAACAEHLGSWKTDDVITFHAQTTSAAGAVTDADSAPTYRIYEDETGTPIVTGTMALLDSSNTDGWYSEQVTLSAANGFEKGKSYAIRMLAPVGGVSSATYHTFQIGSASDVIHIAGSSTPVTQLAEAFDNDGTGGDLDLSTLTVTAGATINNSAGVGLQITGNSQGLVVSSTTGPGIVAQSGGNASGIVSVGAGTGHGAHFLSGAGATGNGILAASLATNGHGLALTGTGTGTGLSGNIAGNLSGSVGSISGVTFPANFSGLTITSGRVNADVTHWLGTAAATPTVSGVPEVDITHVLGDAVCD